MQYVLYPNESQCAYPVKLKLVAIGYSFGTYLKLSSESTVRAIVSCYVIELYTSGSLSVGCVAICRVKEECFGKTLQQLPLFMLRYRAWIVLPVD